MSRDAYRDIGGRAMQEQLPRTRLQDVIGRVESGTETEESEAAWLLSAAKL